VSRSELIIVGFCLLLYNSLVGLFKVIIQIKSYKIENKTFQFSYNLNIAGHI